MRSWSVEQVGSVSVVRPGCDSVGVKVGVDHGVEQEGGHDFGRGATVGAAHGANPKSIAGDTEKPAPRRRRGCW